MKILLKIYIIMMVSVGFAQSGDFLMPDKAFQPYAKVNHQAQIEAGVVLGKSIYLYEDKLSVSIVDSKDVSILQTISPDRKSVV